MSLQQTYVYAMLRQSVAGNLPFRGIVFCNLCTPKIVISKIVTTRQNETTYSSPSKYDLLNDVPGGQKIMVGLKKISHNNV